MRRAAQTIERQRALTHPLEWCVGRASSRTDVPNAEFVVGMAERLPFPDEAFTAVLSTTAVHHFPGPERALREMAHVLRPHVRIALGDPRADRLSLRVVNRMLRLLQPGHVGFYRSSRLPRWLKDAGFSDLELRRIWTAAT